MRNSVLGPLALIAGLCALPVAASAESYICAVTQVYECEDVVGCKQVSTDAINLAELIVLDTDKKTLTGASLNEKSQSEDIEGMELTEKNIFLHGHQGDDTWNATVSLENGAMTGGIASGTSSFALFGYCTKK
jgi:hypothetical protein